MVERRAPLQAQDRLSFLLTLVPFLIERVRISVEETAHHFGVTPQVVCDAVKLIAVSGIPGETGQYQHGDLFDLAWDDFEINGQIVLTNLVALDEAPRFSGREAAALIAGLQYLSALPENADRSAIASLTTKLARGSSSTPSQLAIGGTESDANLAAIRESVATGRRLEFGYVNARGNHERREVDPLRVESVDVDWYLRGWDHLRESVRTFRLDRIEGAAVTSKKIAFRATDIALPERLFEGSTADLIVTVDVAITAEQLIADYIPDGAQTTIVDGLLRVDIRVSHYHGLKRLVAGLPGVVTVVAPAEARRAVGEWATAGAARYGAK